MRLRFIQISVLAALAIFTMSAAEDPSEDHKKWMKELGSQMGAIRKGADVEKNAVDMQETMKHVTQYWAHKSETGMKTSQETTEGAAAIAKAAQAGDKEGIAAGMKMVGGGCKGCHDMHREKVAENVYKIK